MLLGYRSFSHIVGPHIVALLYVGGANNLAILPEGVRACSPWPSTLFLRRGGINSPAICVVWKLIPSVSPSQGAVGEVDGSKYCSFNGSLSTLLFN